MHNSYNQFCINIQNIKDLSATIIQIDKLTTTVVDLSDLLRSQIVLSVSALDHFIHSYVRKGMLEIYSGLRPATSQYNRFLIPLEYIASHGTVPSTSVIEDIIMEKHSYISFQDPDKVAEAIRFISDIELWNELGRKFTLDPKRLKSQLRLITDRRNKIAHEADMDPMYPGHKFTITSSDVSTTITFIENLCKNIFELTI